MRGTYFVAIALLVGAGSQTAAKIDKDEVQQAQGNDFMASASTTDEIFLSRILQVSRKPKDDDSTLSADNEERTPSALSDFIKMAKVPDSIVTVADGMRTEREASAIEAVSKNLNKLRSNERQRIALIPNDVGGEVVRTRLDPDKSPDTIRSDIRLDLAKRQTRKRPTAIMEDVLESPFQHDYQRAPSDHFTINAEALKIRFYKQLVSQKEVLLGEEILREEDLESSDLLRLFEESAHPTAVNRQEASATEAVPKTFIQLESNKRNHIFPTPNNVVRQVEHAPPDPDIFPMSVANNKPSILAKRQKRKRPTAIMENAAKFAKQDDYRPGPSDPVTFNAEAFNDRLNNQLITQKALQLERDDDVKNLGKKNLVSVDRLVHMFEQVDKAAHPTAVNRQETSAIEAASKNLNQLESNTHHRIVPTPNIGIGHVLQPSPEKAKSPVLAAGDIPSTLAQRLKTRPPTAVMNNAARFLATHDFRPTPSGSSAISVESPNGRINNPPITQKALQLDKNKPVDDVESLRNGKSNTVETLLHLRAGNDKSSHFTAVNRPSKPVDWTNDLALGPRPQKTAVINNEVKKIHKAFLEAFNLPFHQYLRETAAMLNVARSEHTSSPNNGKAITSLKNIAINEGPEELKSLLEPDLTKLLGNKDMMLPNDLGNLREAYNVKLVIMYDLFYKFCHDRKNLVKDLPPESWSRNWILQPLYYKQRQQQLPHPSSS